MNDKKIEEIIDSVNEDTGVYLVWPHRLTDNVSFAKVWPVNPSGSDKDGEGYNFYLLYFGTNGCVGAVYDMGYDLHAFIKERSRRQGFMSDALRNVVLPHIFFRGKTEQSVTLKNVEARGLVRKVGFQIIDETNAIIAADAVPKISFPPPDYPGIDSEEEITAIRSRLLKAAALIRMVCDEVSMKVGERNSQRLLFFADELKRDATNVSDYCKRRAVDIYMRRSRNQAKR